MVYKFKVHFGDDVFVVDVTEPTINAIAEKMRKLSGKEPGTFYLFEDQQWLRFGDDELFNHLKTHNLNRTILKITEKNATTGSENARTGSENARAGSENARTGTVHEYITCDGCGMSPIVGKRFKCSVCHNYDLCEKCEEKNVHSEEHPLVLFKVPPVAAFHGNNNNNHHQHHHQGWRQHHMRRNGCAFKGMMHNLWNAAQGQSNGKDKEPATRGTPMNPVGTASASASASSQQSQQHPCHPCHPQQSQQSQQSQQEQAAPLLGRFVKDVTLYDGVSVSPAVRLTKIWRMRNAGTRAWPSDTRLLFVGGDEMRTDTSDAGVFVGVVPPSEEVDISVELRAPEQAGRYVGYWRLFSASNGGRFGHRVWCEIRVEDEESSEDEAKLIEAIALAESSGPSTSDSAAPVSAPVTSFVVPQESGDAESAFAALVNIAPVIFEQLQQLHQEHQEEQEEEERQEQEEREEEQEEEQPAQQQQPAQSSSSPSLAEYEVVERPAEDVPQPFANVIGALRDMGFGDRVSAELIAAKNGDFDAIIDHLLSTQQ